MTDKTFNALNLAYATFRHYGYLHEAKPDPVKAEKNFELAAQMLSAMQAYDPKTSRELTTAQDEIERLKKHITQISRGSNGVGPG